MKKNGAAKGPTMKSRTAKGPTMKRRGAKVPTMKKSRTAKAPTATKSRAALDRENLARVTALKRWCLLLPQPLRQQCWLENFCACFLSR